MLSIFYICFFSFTKIFTDSAMEWFSSEVSDYARKTNYDWPYIICENNCNKAWVPIFCKVLVVLFIIFFTSINVQFCQLGRYATLIGSFSTSFTTDLLSKYWKILRWCFLYSI